MFTGIVEEIGSLANIQRQGNTLRLSINAKKITNDVHLGDSVAVNGVCLTVVTYSRQQFTVEVMPVTFQATNLVHMARGAKVNLERAMAANGRFGGHFVTGHVDGVGKILNTTIMENALIIKIGLAGELHKYCHAKGSIALDGTSLTIVEVGPDWFTVSLIPHTQSSTVLGTKRSGAVVNLECDMLLKPRQMAANSSARKISSEFLAEHGFI